jgi:hypothetical protein
MKDMCNVEIKILEEKVDKNGHTPRKADEGV